MFQVSKYKRAIWQRLHTDRPGAVVSMPSVRACRRKYLMGVGFYVMACVAWAQHGPDTLLDKIIARVDDQIVLKSELETACQQYLAQGGDEVPDLPCRVLAQIIMGKVLFVKAKQADIPIAEEVVSKTLDDRMRDLLVQFGSETALVRHWGKPIGVIRGEVKAKVREQFLMDSMYARLFADVSATPREVRSFFESLSPHERPYYPASVVVRQIVKYPQVDQREIDTLVAQLGELKVRLHNGEDFEVLAQAYAQGLDGVVLQGEDWEPGELLPAYEAAALTLQPGEVSDPVVTESGVYLIQLIARGHDRHSSRHILLKPQLHIEAAKTQLNQLREDIMAGRVTFVQAAKEYSDDLSSQSVGGLLTTQQDDAGSVFVDDLPSDVFFAIEQMVPGDVSSPIMAITSDHREAVRILLLEEKIPPHRADLAQDYAKVRQLLIEQKQAAAVQDSFEALKADTFIEVASEYQDSLFLQ